MTQPAIDVSSLECDLVWGPFIDWARRIGGGFHPDNRAADYESPLDNPVEYDAAMDLAFAAGAAAGLDPYELALAVVPPP